MNEMRLERELRKYCFFNPLNIQFQDMSVNTIKMYIQNKFTNENKECCMRPFYRA